MSLPLVTAVLILDRPAWQRLAQHAVRQFLAQTYPHKHLLVINSTSQRVCPDHEQITEQMVQVEPSPSYSFWYNFALNQIHRGYVKPWPVDHLFDPTLLAYQVTALGEHLPWRACLLGQQIRVNLLQHYAFVYRVEQGIPETICHPVSGFRCAEDEQTDPLIALSQAWSERAQVALHPACTERLQISVYHSQARQTEADWLGPYSAPAPGQIALAPRQLTDLYFRLQDYGVRLRLQAESTP